MKFVFPDNEKELRNKIDDLNNRWFTACPENFVRYGFYPHYTEQKCKILFVARETRGLGDNDDYICLVYKRNYTDGVDLGNFHYRILELAYGILKGFPNYAVAKANRLKAFQNYETSFAFMNVSTIGNLDKNFQTNMANYQKSNSVGLKFRREMIELLAPDVIICANCGADISLIADCSEELLKDGSFATTELLRFGDKKSLRIDTYHWSITPKGGAEKAYYESVKNAYQKFINLV